MPHPLPSHSPRPSRALSRSALAAAVFAAALAALTPGCSRDRVTVLAPAAGTPGGDPSSVPALTVEGAPRVTSNFNIVLTEVPAPAPPLQGTFRVFFLDSLARRAELEEVLLNQLPMRIVRDPLGGVQGYELDAELDLPTLRLADTLRLAVRDSVVTPPFSLVIVPSRVLLPADSTRVSQSSDIVLPWTGQIERLIFNIFDVNARRLRVVYNFENYTGQSRLRIPAADLKVLTPGPITVSVNILDTELIFTPTGTRQIVQLTTQQGRYWILTP